MAHHDPVPYIARTHAYYRAQGFEHAYRYAQHDDAPFTPLARPLAACTVGLVTTASVYHREPLEPRKVVSGRVQPPPARLYTDDLSWDKQATHTDDVNSFLPVAPLRTLVEEGVVARLAEHFQCAPTEYSQRTTIEKDAPEILRRLRDDAVDIALLVPL